MALASPPDSIATQIAPSGPAVMCTGAAPSVGSGWEVTSPPGVIRPTARNRNSCCF